MSKPTPSAKKIIDFLNCPCTYFPAGKSRKHITAAYEDAFGKRNIEGFVPVIVVVDDILAEQLDYYQNNYADGENGYNNIIAGAEHTDAVKWFKEQLTKLKAEFGESWEDSVIGEMEYGEPNNYFRSFMDFQDKKSKECILAKIPVDKPWEVLARLPFGGWNECPDPETMVSVAKYWYERYGVIPAVISHDTLELAARPIPDKGAAMGAALEHLAFCQDVIFQGYGTLGSLADSITGSFVWYFWWD